MRLYGIVPAVIGLLQCEGRVSYRALQVECALDAATLEALRVELVTVKQLAVDQDGEMLVWRGRALSLPVAPSARLSLQTPWHLHCLWPPQRLLSAPCKHCRLTGQRPYLS